MKKRKERINKNTQRKVEYNFISKSSPFIGIDEEIYINMDDHL